VSDWKVDVVPEGKNDGKNEGGLVIYLTNGDKNEEVCGVGFIRRNSGNPKEEFEPQLDQEIAKAQAAARTINELLGNGARMR
jgi:hypothetical protein